MECLGGHCSSSSISSSSSLQSPLSPPGAGTEDGTHLSSIADGHCCGQRPLVSPAQMGLQREGTKPHVGFYNPLCLKNAMDGAGEIAVLNTEVLLPPREWLEMLPSVRLVFPGKIVKPLPQLHTISQYVSQTLLCKGFLHLHRSPSLLPQELRPSSDHFRSPHHPLPLPVLPSRCSLCDSAIALVVLVVRGAGIIFCEGGL